MSVFGQKQEKIIIEKKDPSLLYVNDGDSTTLYYYQMVPDVSPIGVLVILPSAGESTESVLQQVSLHTKALENGILVVVPSINWGTDDRKPEISFLDKIFKQVVTKFKVSKDKFILCGLSNGGMISLRYGINSVKESNTFLVPKAIIGLDPPLDFAHFYDYCQREIKRNFTPAGVAEAKWMLNNYNSSFGGSPKEFPEKYQEASLFTYGADKGGNTKYLTNIAIRMHSDLNINYLLNERKRDLYDWNGTDIVAFVNQLKINGNQNAEVIITTEKGVRPNGMKHPHSWSIMDTDDTLKWILEVLEN